MSLSSGSYDESTWSDDLAQAIAAQRRQVRLLAEQRRQKLDELHVRLEDQLRALSEAATTPSGPALEQLTELERELDKRRQALDERELELLEEHERWQERIDQANHESEACVERRAQLEAAQQELAAQREELERERIRHKKQRRRWTESQRQAPQATRSDDSASQRFREELAQLKAKYDMALGDLRDLRRRNAELESRGALPISPKAETDGFDWESQKRRMIDALEAELQRSDPIDETRAEERLTIEGTIRITDQVVAEKDRQIAELQAKLRNAQSRTVSEVDQLTAQDEIVQQERQRLAELRAEWETKCRLGEVELAQERAKLARERAEFEDQRQGMANNGADATSDGTNDPAKPRKPGGSRWLSRLGLSSDE